jgi:hypothetical protein
VTELQQGSGIRNLLIEEVDPKEASHSIAVIDGFFHSFIGKIEPVLQELHAEHDFDINRPSATFLIVVVGLDEIDPLTPWNDCIHRIQKSFPFGFTPSISVFNVTE